MRPQINFKAPAPATARGRFIFKGSDQQLRAPCSKVVAETNISRSARRDRCAQHRPALSSRRQCRRPMSYHLIPADTNTQLDLFEDQGAQPLVAQIWRKEKNGFYVDPQWCLYEDEPFVGSQWDPFCGIGRCSDAARRCGCKTYATDIVDRGYQHFDRTLNFLLCERALGNNIVTNPPFQICDQACDIR
jgi:hypothetical protein